jgi:hypothetical protein
MHTIHRTCEITVVAMLKNPEMAGPKRTSCLQALLFGQFPFFDSWVSLSSLITVGTTKVKIQPS